MCKWSINLIFYIPIIFKLLDSFRNKNSIYIYYLQNKNRLENEIDNLPIDAKHRERKLEDISKRYQQANM